MSEYNTDGAFGLKNDQIIIDFLIKGDHKAAVEPFVMIRTENNTFIILS